MPAIQQELGEHLYLFCHEKHQAPNLIISSHGGQSGGTFKTEKALQFYTQKGDVVIDHTVAAIIREAQLKFDGVKANVDTDDYDLSKYQTGKKADEGVETYEDLLRAVNASESFDILSIRHRTAIGKHETLTLSEVLRKLKTYAPERFASYNLVHCSFCRV
jgi:putative adhesin Stv-like protein